MVESHWIDVSGLLTGSLEKLTPYLNCAFQVKRIGDNVYLIPEIPTERDVKVI